VIDADDAAQSACLSIRVPLYLAFEKNTDFSYFRKIGIPHRPAHPRADFSG
jgi:hypothetical protein